MDDAYILQHVDHTLLKASATWSEIEQLCDEAVKYNTASVCIPPYYVGRTREAFPDLNICTVIGFPLGYDNTSIKIAAAQFALEDGADEIDMVVNLTDVKNRAYGAIIAEVSAIRAVTGTRILKVIVETCYLTEDEKINLCNVITDTEADYIKTSTGFGTGGATMEDVLLFKKHIGPDVKIKAAGGIRSREEMAAYIEAGCSRLGTSSAIKLLTGGTAASY